MPRCKDDCAAETCLRCNEDCIAVQDAFVQCTKDDDDTKCTAVYEKIKAAKAKMK